jgi:hypothetical protein
VSTIYDGRKLAGYVVPRGRHLFEARSPDGELLGIAATELEAAGIVWREYLRASPRKETAPP